MTAPSASTLRLTLAGVLSWSRPRPGRGTVRYEGSYGAGRDGWALLTRAAVAAAGWAPPTDARYIVDVLIHGGGKRDIDRVLSAALDALQAGGAIRDDALCDVERISRLPLAPGERDHTDVTVTLLLADKKGAA